MQTGNSTLLQSWYEEVKLMGLNKKSKTPVSVGFFCMIKKRDPFSNR